MPRLTLNFLILTKLMKKLTLLFFLLIFIISLSLTMPLLSKASGDEGGSSVSLSDVNPLGSGIEGISGMRIVIGRVINAILGITGSFALFMFIYGGFSMLTSAGSPEKIDKGKKILTWAIIGIMVILGSYAITNFIFGAITSTGSQ